MQVLKYLSGIGAFIIFTTFVFWMFVITEVIQLQWIKKTTHTIEHIHPDYVVKQKLIKFVPVVPGHVFGFARDTEEVKRYSK